jgi:hypothetical protein
MEKMRESNIGHELKDMAQEVVRFGERCVQAGRNWLNERRDEMNHRNDEDRRDYQSSQQYGAKSGDQRETVRQGQGRHEYDAQSDRNRPQQQYAQGSRTRGEYYGGEQFDERAQSVGWNEDRANWDYEGGPERYGASGYTGSDQGTRQQSGRLYGSQPGGRREYGSQNTGASDYYSGRQGYVGRGSTGSEYNIYGRSQGYGEGAGLSRSQSSRSRQFSEGQNYGSANLYGGESSGSGGRGSLYGRQDYLDDGEMSGYGRGEPGSQQYGTSSGRYGTAPGQYGYGGYAVRTGSFRGVGPKNYTRSDERLMEDINERLTDDDDLDASDISVRVSDGKVTLEGTVDQRWMKHRAEDLADSCIGIKEVDNRILVTSGSSVLGQRPTETRTTTTTPRASQSGATTPGTSGATTTGTTGGTTPH